MGQQINEVAISEARAKGRQNKQVTHLVREDGMLFPNVPLVAKKRNFRPYHGDLKAPLEDRIRAYNGQHRVRAIVNSKEDEGPFDIGKAAKDEIVAFAFEEYGLVLDPADDVRTVRKKLMAYANTIGAAVGKTPAGGDGDGGSDPQ